MSTHTSTGHSIFSLIPSARVHRSPRVQGGDLSVDVPRVMPGADSESLDIHSEDLWAVADGQSELELRFPAVLALLQRVWGTSEATRAFRALILDRNGRLRRWPAAAWQELSLLRNVHDAAYVHGVDLPAHPATGRPDPARFSVLEVSYRHVLERLVACWGNVNGFNAAFQGLVLDDRGDREGWPADAWRELVFLQQVHERAYGRLPTLASVGRQARRAATSADSARVREQGRQQGS